MLSDGILPTGELPSKLGVDFPKPLSTKVHNIPPVLLSLPQMTVSRLMWVRFAEPQDSVVRVTPEIADHRSPSHNNCENS